MSGYIRSLRSVVGTRPLVQCGATVIVIDAGQRVLMLRRKDNKSWCFPGGSLELGESLEDAARREVLEEAGLQVGELHLLSVFSGKDLYYRYPNGDEVYNVDIVYHTRDYRGGIEINPESTEFAFFSLEAIPSDVSPPQRVIVEYVRKHFPQAAGS